MVKPSTPYLKGFKQATMYTWIPIIVKRAKSIGKKYSLDWKFSFNKEATTEDISRCEEALGSQLSQSHRLFLCLYNGARLFWGEGHGIQLLSTKQIAKATLKQRRFYQDSQEVYTFILFAKLEGLFDCLGMDPEQKVNDEYRIIDCFHEEPPDSWVNSFIAPSFDQFLRWIFHAVVHREESIQYWLKGVPLEWTGDDPPPGDPLSIYQDNNNIDEKVEVLRQKALEQPNDYQRIIGISTQILTLKPRDPGWYCVRARAYSRLSNSIKALEDYDVALQINSGIGLARIDRAILREQLGDKQGAIDDYTYSLNNYFRNAYRRKGIDTGSYGTPYFYPLICFKRGILRAELGDLIGSKEDFQEAARTYQLENLPDEANQALEKIKDLNLLDP